MKKLLNASLIFTLVLLSCSVVFAATTTPEPTEESEEKAKTDGETLNEILKNSKNVKGLTSDGEQRRGFIGTVKRVSEEAITVDTRKGTEVLTISSDVSILQDGKAFKVNNIEIDSQLAILGYQDGEDFNPRRILVLKKPLQSTQKTIWVGSVKKIDKLSITLTTRSNEERTFSLATKPVIENNKGDTLKMTDIETDQDILLITIPEDSTSQAIKDSSGKIVRLRSLVASDEKTDAQPTPKTSVKPTATPKASATKKPTATPAE